MSDFFERRVERMEYWFDILMKKWNTFTICDFGMFKLGFISFGSIIGMYTYEKLLPYTPIIWAIFIFTYAYLIFKMCKSNGSIMDRVRNFELIDYIFTQATLISVGILLSLYFISFMTENIELLWVIWIYSYLCLFLRVIFD